MAGDSVISFEARAGRVTRLAAHESLSASSAALPEGAYTTLRTYGGRRLLQLDRHLARLEESVALQGHPSRLDAAGLRAAIGAALDATGFAESRLRLTFAPPRSFVAVEPYQPLPGRLYEAGVACATLELQRDNPHAKDTRFIVAAQGAYRQLLPGVEEGLLVAADGALLEGLSSNFFALLDGALHTESERVLLGVTRSLVLEVAAALVRVDERAIRRADLPRAAEAFITSVSRGVLPVVRIDGKPVGDGLVGPLTTAVMRGFAALVEREAERL